jgi:hypothetical protein
MRGKCVPVRGVRLGVAASGLLLVCACAGGPKLGESLAPEDARKLAEVKILRVECSNRDILRETAVALVREGGPALTTDAKAAAVFKVEADCGADFDYWRPPPPINQPGAGMDDNGKEHRYEHSPNASRACEVRADFLLDGHVLWTESNRTSNVSEGDLISLSNALVARFVKVWKDAKAPEPVPAPKP